MKFISLGGEVALFAQKYLVVELRKLENFKKKDYRSALTDVFMKMDIMMLTKEGKKELSKFAKINRDVDY